MLEDRVGDAGLLTRGERVVAAHHALQRRELDDDVRDEVGLAQVSGAGGVGGHVRACAHHRGERHASVSTRSDFAFSVPRRSWNTMLSSSATRDSSEWLRSSR